MWGGDTEKDDSKMSEKRTRLSNGDKMAILEAIRTPGFKREDIMKQYNISQSDFYNIVQQKDKLFQGFTEPYSVLLTPRKRKRL